jgi:selenide, water dikinase
LPAATLADALKDLPAPTDARLLVGHTSADDAAIYRLTDELALVQTLDFFTPIVDDPYSFGRVAAANALSDVFAMGGTPTVALNIVCFPDDVLGADVLGEILRGGHDVVHEAGAVIGGGHSVSDKELKYGLAVTGTVHPDRFWQNAGAQQGDVLVLTKGIGTGVLSTGIKKGKIGEAEEQALIDVMATLNRKASEVGQSLGDAIHAATDITGYGLLGHAIEVARASQLRLHIDALKVPLLPGAEHAAKKGWLTRGETTNLDYLRGQAAFGGSVSSVQRSLLLDPQTSGGLLFFVAPDQADELVAGLRGAGVDTAEVIGRTDSGEPGIDVSA